MRWLGLPAATLRMPALKLVKDRLVMARNNRNDDLAATLSQVKSFINRNVPDLCGGCGVVVKKSNHSSGIKCQACALK